MFQKEASRNLDVCFIGGLSFQLSEDSKALLGMVVCYHACVQLCGLLGMDACSPVVC